MGDTGAGRVWEYLVGVASKGCSVVVGDLGDGLGIGRSSSTDVVGTLFEEVVRETESLGRVARGIMLGVWFESERNSTGEVDGRRIGRDGIVVCLP
jgi:hypothetical protein